MTDKPAKVARRYSKTTLALSDPPRRAKVEIEDGMEESNLQVSATIAHRIEKLYHHQSHTSTPRQNTNEKQPFVLNKYERGVSDTETMMPKSKIKQRPYSSVGESYSGGVTIAMRNGEVLMFNDTLDAFEVHDKSPNSKNLDKSLSSPVKSMSLPRHGNSLREMMNQMNKENNSKCEGDSNEILKCQEESLTDKIHSNDVTNSQSNKLKTESEISKKREYDNDENLKNSGQVNYTYQIVYNTSDVNQDDNTSKPENTKGGDISSDKEQNPLNVTEFCGNDISPSDSDMQNEDGKNFNVKRGKYTATGPAMRKIDKYRESLRKRKKDNRSVSEPFVDQVFDDSNIDDFNQSKTVDSPIRTPSASSDSGTKQRKYYSKSADRPATGVTSYNIVVKSTSVSRSNSLGNLSNWKLTSSLEDIPKGIAKSKILEIQKKVEQQDGKNITESSIWFASPTSPRVMSPTGSGASTPRNSTLSPTSSNVSSFTPKYDTSTRYRTLSPTNSTVSSLASKYDTQSSHKQLSSHWESTPLSPKTKQDALNILQHTLPRSFSQIPMMDNRNKESPRNQRSMSLIPQSSVHTDDVAFVFPKPAPRTKRRASLRKNSKSGDKINFVSTPSSTSSSVYSSTQSSGDDTSDKPENTPPPKRPARGVKRASVDTAIGNLSYDSESTSAENVQTQKRNSKIPYTQVTPTRKQGLKMGVNSYKRKGPAPDPPVNAGIVHSPPPLERQACFSKSVSIVQDSIEKLVSTSEEEKAMTDNEDDSAENSEDNFGSCFTFVEGKSEASCDDKNTSYDPLPLENDDVPKLNLLGVTEDSSTDYEPIQVYDKESDKIYTIKEPIYADIEICESNETDDSEDLILPAPIDFSDMGAFIHKDSFPIYSSVNKDNKDTQQQDDEQPVPPPRLKKSASGDIKKLNSDINGNDKKSEQDIDIDLCSSDTTDPPSTSIEDDSDDTLVHNEQNRTSTECSSSEDLLDDDFDPLYETIENMKTHQGSRLKRNVKFDLENNNSVIEYNNFVNNDQDDDNVPRNNNETINYPLSYITQDNDFSPSSIMKTSTKSKKEKKKSKKRSQSASPKRAMETLRNSSDEDLLEERSRKRTLSPTSVIKDTVKKMLRVRPGSPKEKSEKTLSTSDPNYMNNAINSKKGYQRSLSSMTPSSSLPGDQDGITLLSISKKSSQFHIDFDSHSAQQQCQHCDKHDHTNEDHVGFDINRYAGSPGKKPTGRASKSMGDIHEAMRLSNKDELAGERVIHKDAGTLDSNHRKLPLTPSKRSAPILVKVLGKDEDIGCQYSCCPFEHMQAVKICHHSDCQEQNAQQPLMLCHACDKTVHDDPNFNSHLRFDIFKKGGNLNRNVSTRSLPGLSQSDDEGGGVEGADDEDTDAKKNNKLRRKKVMKKRNLTDESESKAAINHVRSKSLQEHEFRDKPRASDMSGKYLNKSESAIQTSVVVEEKDNENTNDLIGSQQDSQESVFADDTERTNQESENTPHNQSGDSLHNKSSESMQDIEGEEDDGEFSSILNSSPGTESAFKKPDSSLLDISDSSSNQSKPNSANEKASAGRDQVDSATVKKTTKSKIPHSRKTKDDSSKKYTMGMEYFTLKFDILDDPEVYEIVAAVKGVSLRDAVYSSLEKRGINVNYVDIFLASSNTALPLQVDCFPLGGNHLHVKAKDNEQLSRINRSISSNSLTNVKPPKQSFVPRPSKPVPIYLKRDQQNRASLTPTPHALDPPVMHHRRLSQRPRSFSHGVIKNETHPLVNRESVLNHREESQRNKKVDDSGMTVSDISPHGTISGTDPGKLKSSGRSQSKLTNLFSPFAKSKHEALQQQLENYSINGLPGMPLLLTMGKPEYDENVFTIEKHWTDVVGVNRDDLSKKQGDQQETIWELLHTEVEHIKKLKVIIDLYLSCLMDLQNETLLNDVKTEDAFSNIVEVCECNQQFWDIYLRPVLEHSRKTKKLLDPSLLKEGFMKFEEIFKPYAKYCLEQKACLDYIRAKQSDNELFKTFIEWAEAQKQCNRLRLLDLIIMPMQRLTKYKLLLLAILKKTDKEEHRKELIHMVEKVERFVIQVNQVMHQRAEHERLSMIIERIEAYDVIDAPNIDEVQRLSSDFCKLDLTCPVPGCGPQQRRHLLLEGGLKFREANSRLDVYCFLFTDMLLITKPNKKADKVKVTKPPMRLDKCVVRLLKDGLGFMLVYLNEYHVASGVYTFHGESAKIWVDHVHRAQDAYKHLRKQALEKSENRMYWEMFYEENYEDDLAVMNTRHNKSDTADRQDSSSSAESFMPNMDNFPRSTSHGQLRYDPVSQDSRRLRVSNSLDENAVAQLHINNRDTVQRSDSEPIRANLSLPRHSISDYQLSNEQSDSPAATTYSRSSVQPDVYYAKSAKQSSKTHRTDSQSSGDGQLVRPAYRTSKQTGRRELPERPTSISDETEHRSKLNPKRMARNEKRYHTADAIQELRKDNRDNSIHKRLSWNLGTVDINIDDRQNFLKHKTFSSDSIKSMPSSSGVSSTGSLHLSPESEICEDDENYEDDEDSALMNQHIIRPLPISAHHGMGYPLSFDDNNHSDSSTNESSATLTADFNPNQIDESSGHHNSNHHHHHQSGNGSDSGSSCSGQGDNVPSSKSLPDIAHISIREVNVKEGVGSAEVRGDRKMTHKELRNMKKQLLLNSTLEASEV